MQSKTIRKKIIVIIKNQIYGKAGRPFWGCVAQQKGDPLCIDDVNLQF